MKPFVTAILRVLLVSAMLAGCGGIGLVKQAPRISASQHTHVAAAHACSPEKDVGQAVGRGPDTSGTGVSHCCALLSYVPRSALMPPMPYSLGRSQSPAWNSSSL